MAPINKIEVFFSKHPLNERNLKELSQKFSDDKFIKNSEFLFDSKKNILTFSNSSCVRRVLIYYKHRIQNIFCCHSLPLAEGEVIRDELQKKNINATLIEDMEITKYFNKIDFILIGTDAIGEKFFINKVGTKLLVLFAANYKLPVYVIATSVKLFSAQELEKIKIGEYFEKIEKGYIRKFIL